MLVMSTGRQDRQPWLKRALTSIERFANKKIQIRPVLNPQGIDRESQILNSSADWIFFLDEDCEIPGKTFFETVHRLTLSPSGVSVFGGLYLDPPQPKYGTQAYNRLCNLWTLKTQHDNASSNLLGGCLLVHASAVKADLLKNPISWGGEDTFFLRKLQEAGHRCSLDSGLSVIHNPPPTPWLSFFRRAFLHGRHREKFYLQSKGMSREGLKYLLTHFRFWPLWALHFFLLECGAISQSIGRTNK